MTSQSAYVRIAPSPRLRDTHSAASAELIQLRVQHLLPQTTQRAKARVGKLKKLFTTPTAVMLREHAEAQAETLDRLRLVKSIRNIKVQKDGGGPSSAAPPNTAAGALCLPLHSCAAAPVLSTAANGATPLSCVLTGSVDGLLTVWDAEQCTPLASQSTFPQGRGWGRVKSIAVYPNATTSAAATAGQQCFAFTASMFQSEVRVWRIAVEDASLSNEEEAEEIVDGTSALPRVSLEAVATAPTATSAGEAATTTAISSSAPSSPYDSSRLGGLQQLAVDPTGALLAATHDSGVVHLWDVRSVVSGAASSPLVYLYAQDGYETAGATLGVAFHPDGSLLTTTDAGGRVVAWDTRSGQLAFHTGGRVGGHLRAAPAVAWSPCGVRLASGGADGVVHVYDARKLSRAGVGAHNDGASGATPFQLLGHDDTVTSLSFYPNALSRSADDAVLPVGLVTTSLDHTMRVWDADTGLCVRALDAGMPLYGHCRPALQPLSTRFTASTAVVAVGHGKNWLVYDVGLRGEVLEDVGGASTTAAISAEKRVGGVRNVEVQENNIVASADGAAGGMKLSEVASVAQPAVGVDGSDSDDEEEEEEDEMLALMKSKAAPVASAPPVRGATSVTNDQDSGDEESSEDEMEMLKKK